MDYKTGDLLVGTAYANYYTQTNENSVLVFDEEDYEGQGFRAWHIGYVGDKDIQERADRVTKEIESFRRTGVISYSLPSSQYHLAYSRGVGLLFVPYKITNSSIKKFHTNTLPEL